MNHAQISIPLTLSDFFTAADERGDRWAELAVHARAWAGGEAAAAARVRALLAAMEPAEACHAYPGRSLLAALQEQVATGLAEPFARLADEIRGALASGRFRHDADAWDPSRESESSAADYLPAPLAPGAHHRPYFEVLNVSAIDPQRWDQSRTELRRLRRPEDPFVYELLQAGSFEDALLAVLFNPLIQAVVIQDAVPVESRHDLSRMRSRIEHTFGFDPGAIDALDRGPALARVIHRIRPELDLYLTSERDIEALSLREDAGPIRRMFRGAEELMELHLALMEGVGERFLTPFFDNLKHYAQRPMGTFHALPVARGKSVFKSHWIRDMGEFYGANLFLAESSATTGGLDSLLEPTGNIRLAQEAAARAFGGEHAFFVTNGTSTSNKIVHQAILRPGDIVLIDRDCHKSHHYGLVLAGARPCYIDAYPLAQYSMYGSVPIGDIKKALLDYRAAGCLDRVRMLVLTNCTFDGHVSDCLRVMEECLAIKPDLVFLWDEAWYGYARFTPFLRRRSAMGAAALLEQRRADPTWRALCAEARAAMAALDPADPKLLELRWMPDPDAMRVRVYETDSVHKSMSSLRQGSIVVVRDQDFQSVEEAFHEAYFTHTSTSPNLQIIASLDVARRQMELEGYGLVMGMIQLALRLRREINGNPLVSRYFRAATPEDMIPARFRQSGFRDYGGAGTDWDGWLEAVEHDEFVLDPTRITVLCGRAGMDGSQFKALLAERYDIQINKTSRNSVLVQLNINNTRSDLAHLLKALADIARDIERRVTGGAPEAKAAFEARVRALVEDVPDLPDFSRFHDAFRDRPDGATVEGDMRSAYYMAYAATDCEHLPLASPEVDRRLAEGPEMVSANFVIPYPPGFPIMVPGQVIDAAIIGFMRKLDVKEIHGYQAELGLKLLRTDALARKARG